MNNFDFQEIRNRKMLSKIKKERNNFTSTLIFDSYYYYAAQLFFDSSVILQEIRCLDLTYLMEQRFRYTKIRDELELPHLMGEFRRKCKKCLIVSDDEQEKDPESGKSEGASEGETEDISQSKSEQKSGETSKTSDAKKTAGEKSDSQQQKRRKSRKKTTKSKDLEVLKRFWFKRKPSPPPRDELEQHLYDLRIRTRKEIHTLLFLNSAAVNIYLFIFFLNSFLH